MILPSVPLVSLVLGLAAAAAYAAPAAGATRMSMDVVRKVLLAAWVLHGLALAYGLVGVEPRFGFAPSLSVTAWLALTVYGVESRMFPELRALGALTGLGAAAVLVALVFPGTPMPHNSSPWLPLHWALGIASYGLFAAAVFHAWLMMRAEKQMRQALGQQSGVPLLTLERLTFRFVMAGFVLLSATLLAGWLFAETLYGPGKAWQWNHKTVFSLLSWFAFATLLVGRARFGWRGRTAVRVLYVGSFLLLLGYAGSRFVLEVILGRAT